MSDWEFLYEMHSRGYSPEEISDAMACGYAPWEEPYEVDIEWDDSPYDIEEKIVTPNKQKQKFQSRKGKPICLQEQREIFQELIDCAERHFENTGRYLQIWGELGEIYAEIEHGLSRHETHTAGSDGIISNKRVEVKTISPEKTTNTIQVKRQGNFEQLLIVKIDENFNFQSKLFNRDELNEGLSKIIKVSF